MDIAAIQDYLSEHELDGWLLADFHARNTIAVDLLKLSGLVTRRSFYFIPAMGEPTGLVHAIEREKFRNLPGKIITYSGYQALEKELARMLGGVNRLAMEYSSRGRLPYIGLVDAGTIELVREMGIEVLSSANLVAYFGARLSVEQIATHRMAARNLIEVKDRTFAYIAKALTDGVALTEFDVMQHMLSLFEELDMLTESGPNCSVDANAGDPHYEPQAATARPVKKGQLILIDLWAKIKRPDAIYGDITWMAYAGKREEIPAQYREIFAVLVKARDAAVEHIRKNIEIKSVKGAEVDEICRKVIVDAGYGKYFTHRTGHSITSTEHGSGPNIDNLETEDSRKLRKGHLFSIEPGIYMQDFGFRTEINMLIGYDGAEITTLPLQMEIVPLF